MPENKKLSERDISTQHITPALQRAAWNFAVQIRGESTFTRDRVILRRKMHTRGKQKCADCVLNFAPNLLIAVIEAADNTRSIGDAFFAYDRTGPHKPLEEQLTDVAELLVPLPLLAERHSTVAKIDELITLCDHLKSDLADCHAKQFRLSAPASSPP